MDPAGRRGRGGAGGIWRPLLELTVDGGKLGRSRVGCGRPWGEEPGEGGVLACWALAELWRGTDLWGSVRGGCGEVTGGARVRGDAAGPAVRPGQGWALSWLRELTGSCARRRPTPPAGLPAARQDRASSSRERSTSRGRGAARSSSRESGRGARGRGRAARPSPSPPGGRAPRFDPTAFVKAKEKKQKEIRMKQQQQRNRLGSGGSGDGPSVSWSRQARPPAAVTSRGDTANRSRHRSSSVDSFRSRCSSVSSCSEFEDFTESRSRGLRCHRRGKPPSPTPWSGSNTKSTPRECSNQRRLTGSGGWVPIREYSSDHQAVDMAEIDARLKALQEYMNRLDTQS